MKPLSPLPEPGTVLAVTDRFGGVLAGVAIAGTDNAVLVVRTARNATPVRLLWADLTEVNSWG